MLMIFFITFHFILLFFFNGSFERIYANNPVQNFHFENKDLEVLSQHPYWQKLLHYYHPGEPFGQWSTRSDVISPNFFLHPQGNTDPELELQATLQAILEPVGEDPDQHVRCRFIEIGPAFEHRTADFLKRRKLQNRHQPFRSGDEAAPNMLIQIFAYRLQNCLQSGLQFQFRICVALRM